MAVELSVFLVLLAGLACPSLGEFCTERYYYGGRYRTTRTFYCEYGCCGSYPDEECCSSSVGMIIGICFASIFTIAIVVALVCCCIKKQGARGRVIQSTTVTTVPPNPSVFTVPTGPPPQGAYPAGYGYYPPPPGHYQGGYMPAPVLPDYAQASALPPPYTATTEGPK